MELLSKLIWAPTRVGGAHLKASKQSLLIAAALLIALPTSAVWAESIKSATAKEAVVGAETDAVSVASVNTIGKTASATAEIETASWILSGNKFNFPGGVALVPIADLDADAQVHFNGRSVLLLAHKNMRLAVVGLDTKLTPGMHKLELIGAQNHSAIHFEIVHRDYPTVNFEYPRKYRSYDEPTLARIRREQKVIGRLKQEVRASVVPDMNFAWPLRGRLSSLFGSRRVFLNRTSTHSGLDIARATGTDVTATADGLVMGASDYYFTGNTVIIEHGSGVLSLYAHLNDITVEVGQTVKQGQLIGHVGNTGRSTGPHLHFSIGFNGVWVDPAIVLPKIPGTAKSRPEKQKTN